MRFLAAHLSVCLMALPLLASPAAAQWSPAPDTLLTRWASDVDPDAVLPEHPRPQMVRPDSEWLNLNGLWQYAVRPRSESRPTDWDGKILVPFAIESAMSGIKRTISDEERLWYRREFEAPEHGKGRLLLHFGAVDWETEVWVNGTRLGEHRGGYDSFTFDITDALVADGPQELVVAVWDPTDTSYQPRGKQVSKPRGIWYTAVTGIWQTVWLEPVPRVHVKNLHITPYLAGNRVVVDLEMEGNREGLTFQVLLSSCGRKAIQSGSSPGQLKFNISLSRTPTEAWSPDSPVLHDLELIVSKKGKTIDRVKSYFGLRDISLVRDERGVQRLALNGKPLFQFGPLDQGWWPDGLYTAPTDEALRYDLEVTKQLGFNMIRKHVKIEPARWYYHCDRIGLLVWQDMPSGDGSIGGNAPDLERSAESEANFRREYRAMIDGRRNHPCIAAWVPFNEGWGQFKTKDIIEWTRKYDPSRLVDGPSGWTDRGVGHMHDVHAYPGPGMPPVEEERAVVLGEFGGLGLPVPEHLWRERDNWGYRSYESAEELTDAYLALLPRLHDLIGLGLAAAVYTQTTDVEGEVNGLLTYDRAVIKMDQERVRAANLLMYGPPPVYSELVPTSREVGQTWRYTTANPGENWVNSEFDDHLWREGPGGLGANDPPNASIRTEWSTPEVWARRVFELDGPAGGKPLLSVYHDEDAEIYLNGVRVAELKGYVTGYVRVPLEDPSLLRSGSNVIAVHCRQTGGGQFIDVGIDVRE
jgi:hypothetical protein